MRIVTGHALISVALGLLFCSGNLNGAPLEEEPVLGGESEKDVNDPQYKELAKESLNQYMQQSGNPKQHTVLRIDKVTTQVVAGTLTRIDFTVTPTGENSEYKCHTKILEQPWLNIKDIDVNCELNDGRSKRDVPPGGESEKDVNDPQYKELAKESLNQYLQQSGNPKQHTVLRIDKVTTQVVAGTLTRIDFTVTPTGENSEYKCHTEILEQPWLNKKDIDVNCELHDGRSKRGIIEGGKEKEVDSDDPQYKELADEALKQLLEPTGDTESHKVARILKVTKQKVSGILTRIGFIISDGNTEHKCHTKVWESSGLNKQNIDLTQCEPIDERSKRDVTSNGEPETYMTSVDPKSVEAIDISTYAVNYLNENSKIQYSVNKVIEVEKEIQVERAYIYTITLSVREDGCQETESVHCTLKTYVFKIVVVPFEKLPNGVNNREVLNVQETDGKNIFAY